MQTTRFICRHFWKSLLPGAFLLIGGLIHPLQAQEQVLSLDDLSAFRDPGKTWNIVEDVTADLSEKNVFDTEKGEGVLVNQPTSRRKGKDLYTNLEHGDLDLELEYMMARGANSGIYLQGMYEVQLLDSWGKKYPTSGDNGGIYERWDESKADGEKGYQGYPPRQNVSKAPGLWQQMKISFRAPRFDEQGNKVENARMLLVELNGVTIHEDVELLGPTRGAMQSGEVARGPLRIQGDHGAVAFRNIKYTLYDNPAPSLSELSYEVYEGKFEEEPNYDELETDRSGSSDLLTSSLGIEPRQFLLRYQGQMSVETAGTYTFDLRVLGGMGKVVIDGQPALEGVINNGSGSLQLEAGTHPVEVVYSKYVNWYNPGLGLTVSGPGVRETIISDREDFKQARIQDPILKEANVNTTLRSFMRLPDDQVVSHAISVGSPEQLHYTYDLKSGTVLQAWRGRFLDATPMWDNRGNGTSVPMGSVVYLSKPEPTLMASDAEAGFTPKGYLVDTEDRPTFRYLLNGVMVHDAIRVADEGKSLRREISLPQPGGTFEVRLAAGAEIKELEDGYFAVDGKNYYLRVDNPGAAGLSVEETGGKKQLMARLSDKLVYSILF
jgi:hypothetical protein